MIVSPQNTAGENSAPASNSKVMSCNQGEVQMNPGVEYVMTSPARGDDASYPQKYAPSIEWVVLLVIRIICVSSHLNSLILFAHMADYEQLPLGMGRARVHECEYDML